MLLLAARDSTGGFLLTTGKSFANYSRAVGTRLGDLQRTKYCCHLEFRFHAAVQTDNTSSLSILKVQ